MYENFFGFTHKPFNMTPDSEFFFESPKHEEALSRLLVAVSERHGFAVITGEIGAGKTTVCRALLNKLEPGTKIALILNTHLGKKELLTTVLEDLSIEYRSNSKTHIMASLNSFLLEEAAKSNNVVLIIDEAQNLTPSVLEEIRMLSNLETEKEKLIQIILMGQPELKKKLMHPRLEQFSQRISMYYHIDPLNEDETKDYIKHRLKVAGYKDNGLFHDKAMAQIYRYSNGIPRLTNLACHHALIGAFLFDKKSVTKDIALEAIEELMHNRAFTSLQKADKKIRQQNSRSIFDNSPIRPLAANQV